MDETYSTDSSDSAYTDSGYGSTSAYDSYIDHSDTANDLYAASTDAQIAGDSYGAYELNAASIQESAASDDSWNQWTGSGDYAATDTSTYTSTYDSSSYDTSSYDSSSYSTDADAA